MNEPGMTDLKNQLNRIERCLIGDSAMGQQGLVASHAEHGKQIRGLISWRDTMKAKIAVIVSAATCGATGALWLFEHFWLKSSP